MRVSHRRVLVCAGTMGVVAAIGLGSGRAAQAVSQAAVTTGVSTDVTVRYARVDGQGKPSGPTPRAVTYHWERSRVGDRWKSQMTQVTADQPLVRFADGPKGLVHLD